MRIAVASAVLLFVVGSTPLLADDPSVLFSDDFSTLAPGWGDANDQKRVEGGKLVLRPKGTTAFEVLYQGSKFNDIDFRVKISQVDGMSDESAGIIFWASGTDHFYVAEFETDGNLCVARYEESSWSFPVPLKVQDAVTKGLNQANEIRVVTKGRSATVYVNDKQVGSFKGIPPDGGSMIGLYAESGDTPYTWQFSDFVVRKPQ